MPPRPVVVVAGEGLGQGRSHPARVPAEQLEEHVHRRDVQVLDLRGRQHAERPLVGEFQGGDEVVRRGGVPGAVAGERGGQRVQEAVARRGRPLQHGPGGRREESDRRRVADRDRAGGQLEPAPDMHDAGIDRARQGGGAVGDRHGQGRFGTPRQAEQRAAHPCGLGEPAGDIAAVTPGGPRQAGALEREAGALCEAARVCRQMVGHRLHGGTPRLELGEESCVG